MGREKTFLNIISHTGQQQGVMAWNIISYDKRFHLVVISETLTAFIYDDDVLELVMLLSICDTLDALLNTTMPFGMQHVLLSIIFRFALHFLSQPIRLFSLSHSAHLGLYEKAIATIYDYWRFSPTVGDNLVRSYAVFHPIYLSVSALPDDNLILGQR